MMKATLPRQFAALGDKTRYAIMISLAKQEGLCVSHLAERFNMTPAAISQHMKVLEQAKLIEPTRNGRQVCYQLSQSAPNVVELTRLIKQEERI